MESISLLILAIFVSAKFLLYFFVHFCCTSGVHLLNSDDIKHFIHLLLFIYLLWWNPRGFFGLFLTSLWFFLFWICKSSLYIFYMIQVSSTICGLQFPQSVDLHFRFLKSTFSKEKKNLKSKELQRLFVISFRMFGTWDGSVCKSTCFASM